MGFKGAAGIPPNMGKCLHVGADHIYSGQRIHQLHAVLKGFASLLLETPFGNQLFFCAQVRNGFCFRKLTA